MRPSFDTLAIVAGVFSIIIIIIIIIYRRRKKKNQQTPEPVQGPDQTPAKYDGKEPDKTNDLKKVKLVLEEEENLEVDPVQPVSKDDSEPLPPDPQPDLEPLPPDPQPDLDLDKGPQLKPTPAEEPVPDPTKDQIPDIKPKQKKKFKQWKTLQPPARILNQNTRYSANLEDIKKGRSKVRIYRYDTNEIYSLTQTLQEGMFNELESLVKKRNLSKSEIDKYLSSLSIQEEIPEDKKQEYLLTLSSKQSELIKIKEFIRDFQNDPKSISDMDKIYHNRMNCFVKMRAWEQERLTYKYHLLVAPSTEDHAKSLQQIAELIKQPKSLQEMLKGIVEPFKDFNRLIVNDCTFYYNHDVKNIQVVNNVFKDVFSSHKYCYNENPPGFTELTTDCEMSLVCSKAFPKTEIGNFIELDIQRTRYIGFPGKVLSIAFQKKPPNNNWFD